MHKVLVNRLGGLSLPRKSVVRLTDSPDMTLDVYRGRKTIQQQNPKPVPNFKMKDGQTYINKQQNYRRKAELAALSQTDGISVTFAELNELGTQKS